mmetsp:Transcript_76481/g.205982  ORF Transcript_76481/g.205982 Transcript_76481/m.205982 type:complete len:779 (+) Transcript_76481:128-2464(+)
MDVHTATEGTAALPPQAGEQGAASQVLVIEVEKKEEDAKRRLKPPGIVNEFIHDTHEGVSVVKAFFRSEYERLTWAELTEIAVTRFPPLRWVPQYTLEKFRYDLTAGLIVGCMLIPQAMAYAGTAGLPAQNGLYTAFTPLIMYCFFGVSRQMGLGPVALISTLVSQTLPSCSKVCFSANGTYVDTFPTCPASLKECKTAPYTKSYTWNPDYQNLASSVALLMGIIMVIFGPLIGWCMNFVPSPVTMGFTTGGGIIIALGQLKDIFGYKVSKDNLQLGLNDLVWHFEQTQKTTLTMSILAMLFLFFIKKLAQGKIFWWEPVKVPGWVRQVALLPWAFGLVVLYTGVSAIYQLKDKGVDVVGVVPAGLPPLRAPKNFGDNIGKIISTAITITIVGYLESIAVETKFAHMFRYQINPTQESIAQGFANILGGCTLSYPAVGSFSRSSTNAAYGSKSALCNLIAAIVIMICLLVLTPYLYHMPKCVLASIVVVAALALVEWPEFLYLWRTNKFEFLVMLTCFTITVFYSMEYGIYVSVGLCGFLVLFNATKPKVTMLAGHRMFIYLPGSGTITPTTEQAQETADKVKVPDDSATFFCHVEGNLMYACAGQLKKYIFTRVSVNSKTNKIRRFIFHIPDMTVTDSTGLKAMTGVTDDVEARGIRCCILGPPPSLVKLMKYPRVKIGFRTILFFENMKELVESGWLNEDSPEVFNAGDIEPGVESYLARTRSKAEGDVELCQSQVAPKDVNSDPIDPSNQLAFVFPATQAAPLPAAHTPPVPPPS